MIEKKLTLNDRRKSFLRTSTIITANDNGIEKINLEDFILEKKIAKTNLGSINICKNTKTNKLYSMKVMNKIDILQSKLVDRITNEFKILANIYHPFIIELKGINNTNPKTLNFLFEYAVGGTLLSELKLKKRFPIEHAKFYLASVVTVIDYLHKRNIIYRDIKPENILINLNGYIKLSDFSYAKKLENITDLTYTVCGTPEYYSPEMINKLGYNISHDFWSLGILLYEMLVGCPPFMDSDPMKIYQNISKCKVSFPKTINKNAKLIIKQFLVADIRKRLGSSKKGVAEIVESPFFEGFDWKGLLYRNLEPPFIPKIKGPNDTSHFQNLDDNLIEEEDIIEIEKEKDPFINW